MKIDYFHVSEIKVSYTDKVKASERAKITCSKDAAHIFSEILKGCMQHHEEFHAMLLNRGNKVLGVSCISKGGIAGTVFALLTFYYCFILLHRKMIPRIVGISISIVYLNQRL